MIKLNNFSSHAVGNLFLKKRYKYVQFVAYLMSVQLFINSIFQLFT